MPEERANMRQTKEQKRAKLAWYLITSIKGKEFAKEYKSYVQSASTLIKTNGLMQTLAFWQSRNKPAYRELLNHITKMIADDSGIQNLDLPQKVMDCDQNEYRNLTTISLACLVWLKRFAESELED
jgi:CRISPR-associated protein Cmr5